MTAPRSSPKPRGSHAAGKAPAAAALPASSSKAKPATKAGKKVLDRVHPSYKDMVKTAILTLKERRGSSRQSIKKFIASNYDVGEQAVNQINLAVKKGVADGTFVQPKGPSGPVKLGKKAEKVLSKPKTPARSDKAKPASSAAAKVRKPATKVRKPAATKKTTTKSAGATKKATGMKSSAKEPTPKKTPIKKAAAVKKGGRARKAPKA